MNFEILIKQYKEFLGVPPTIYFSPGRVNLIGEHIDYLGGRVLPTAITLGTYALVTKRIDNEFHFISDNFKSFDEIVVKSNDLEYSKLRKWANFPVGMIESFVKIGMKIPYGLNVLIYGTLPNGAGLSSSASLEVLMGVVLRDMYRFDISMIDIVKIAQSVENNYIGVNCGIMDQFAVGMSEKNKVIFLNTESLEYELVPLTLNDYVIVIGNTNKKRALSESKYNERRKECEVGLEIVKKSYQEINQLCELTLNDFALIENSFDSVIKKRVKHAVTENYRTKKSVIALKNQNIEEFSKLINKSHESLKNDYEVSCKELDVLVESFRKHGALGARMTGAGFGGCIVSIVHKNLVEKLTESVQKEYLNKIGYEAEFYVCETSDGARKIK